VRSHTLLAYGNDKITVSLNRGWRSDSGFRPKLRRMADRDGIGGEKTAGYRSSVSDDIKDIFRVNAEQQGDCEIGHVLWSISSKMGYRHKIASDFTGYSCQSARVGAVWQNNQCFHRLFSMLHPKQGK